MAAEEDPEHGAAQGGASVGSADSVQEGGASASAIDGAEGLTADQAEEAIAWRVNAHLLYDLYFNCTMEWPALSVDWLPDEEGEPCRLAIGMQTDGNVPHELVVTELSCDVETCIGADPWRRWTMPGLGDIEGFGCLPRADAVAPLKTVARLAHPTEVNRVCPCPSRAQLLATKTADGAVLLFDYKAERSSSSASPDAVFLPKNGQAVDGFALDWSEHTAPGGGNFVASGGNDGRLSAWRVESAPQARGTAPVFEVANAHAGPLCGVSFAPGTSSPPSSGSLASVGDDGFLRLWDLRDGTAPTSQLRISSDEVLAVSWSQLEPALIATGGKDRCVCVWDMRSLKEPLHRLKGHEGDVVAVHWAPFREGLLASCSGDKRLNLWDLDADALGAETEDDADTSAPELLFSHAGHGAGVSDFSWNRSDDYLMCSVAEDNGLHIWQPSADVYLPEDQAGDAGDQDDSPAAKRPRHGGADQ